MANKVLQQLYLSQSPLGQNLLAEDIGDFLNGNTLASLVVRRRTDNSISSLAQLFGDSIALVNDEILVEHLEHFAALQRGVRHADGSGVRLPVD
jgi:hypothetical protein